MTALRLFLPLFRAHMGRLAITLALSIVTLAAGVGLLGVSGWFLTGAALAGAAVSFNLFTPSALVRGLSLLRIVSRYGEKLQGHDTTLKLLSDMRRWLMATLFPRVPLAGRSLRDGDLVSRLTADIDALDTMFLVAIGPVVTATVIGAAVSAILLWLLPAAGWIYLATVVLATLVVPAIMGARTRRLGSALVEAAAAARTTVLDTADGRRDIAVFGQSQRVLDRFAAEADALAAIRRRLGMTAALASGGIQVLAGAALLGTVLVGLQAFAAGAISGPVLAGLVLAVLGSFEATAVIVRSMGKLSAALAAAGRLDDLARTAPLVSDPAHPASLPAGSGVCFDRVTFGYGPLSAVLNDVSLSVPPGEHIAISGPSGSGKSTLLALLLRLCDPQGGAVRIAGIDISGVRMDDVHRRVALLSQESPVFFDTVRANLLIAAPDADDAALWSALEEARLASVVRALPRGLDTLLGESGHTLSAGQARRLCLARVLLSPAPIVALDEPTSGLDRETEEAFLADLGTALAGRTVILVTHAGLPAGAVDRHYRLANGCLTEIAS